MTIIYFVVNDLIPFLNKLNQTRFHKNIYNNLVPQNILSHFSACFSHVTIHDKAKTLHLRTRLYCIAQSHYF